MNEQRKHGGEELLGAYALDALDADEREAVEAELSRSPAARRELDEHRAVAALLAGEGEVPPARVWEGIAAGLSRPQPGAEPAVAQVESLARHRERRGPRTLLAGLAAAAAIVLVVALGAVAVRQGDRLSQVERDLAAAREDLAAVDLEAAAGRAAGDPASRQVALEGDLGTIVAVLEPDGSGYLFAGELPRLAPDRTYQLWGLHGDTPISLGVLGSDPSVAAFQAGSDFDALAISEEPAGGSVAPSAPALVGEVS